jgi:hypothetical protein
MGGGQQPQGTGFFDKASGMFKQAQLDPMFQMGLSLMANSRPSLKPQSFVGNLGMAGLQTIGMQRQQKMDDMKRKLIEAQTGLAGAKTIEALTGGGTSPLTEIGKLRADLLADRITQQEFDAKLNGIMNAEVQAKFENTQKLRVEYTKKVGGVEASLQTLNQAAALSAAGANPIAQLAGFISTIKSIDESTVREGELRTYFAAGGPIQELENLISRSQKEGFSETLRKDIIATIERLRGPLTRELERQRKFYGSEAEKFKLDPESIIGPAFLPVDMGSIGDEDEPMKPPPPGGDGQYDEEI